MIIWSVVILLGCTSLVLINIGSVMVMIDHDHCTSSILINIGSLMVMIDYDQTCLPKRNDIKLQCTPESACAVCQQCNLQGAHCQTSQTFAICALELTPNNFEYSNYKKASAQSLAILNQLKVEVYTVSILSHINLQYHPSEKSITLSRKSQGRDALPIVFNIHENMHSKMAMSTYWLQEIMCSGYVPYQPLQYAYAREGHWGNNDGEE